MLKIYKAYSNHGEIKIEDHIDFEFGEYDTGLQGFGQVKAGNLLCQTANYELQNLEGYLDYLRKVKLTDGYVENFMLWNPVSYQMLEEKYKDISRDPETYENLGLNEEGILLFTEWIYLIYSGDDMVKRIFGRYPETGMYLIKPNASFGMSTGATTKYRVQEQYEVLQSQSLGKQLALTKMNRKI